MGKRSDFKRLARDLYKTPIEAVRPLLPHLEEGTFFIEPCAGDGALVRHLEKEKHPCMYASDILPQAKWAAGARIYKKDFLKLQITANLWPLPDEEKLIITNPPWDWEILKPFLDKMFLDGFAAWLLLPADFAHNLRSAPYMKRCRKYVAIGRVKWIPGSDHGGLENAAWYLFLPRKCSTRFFGRIK